MVAVLSIKPGSPLAELEGDALRARAVEIFASFVGLSYGDPLTRDAYVELLYPHDPPLAARGMAASQSSCALTAMAALRALGVSAPALDEPYGKRVGQAVAIVIGTARAAFAWVDATAPSVPETRDYPRPGDIVVVGRNGGGPAWGRGPSSQFEHVKCVTGYGARGECVSVDGGQPGVGWSTTYPVAAGRELWLARDARRDPDGRPSAGRRVLGWLDLAKLGVADKVRSL